MSYIDTQVKFGERYLYKAYSYDLVVGNQYRYTNPEVYPPLAARYPTQLSRMMGFSEPFYNDEAPDLNLLAQSQGAPATSYMPYQGKQIFVSDFISTDISVQVVGLRGTLYREINTSNASVQEWFNDSYSPYLDYTFDATEGVPLTTELTDIVVQHSETIRTINLTRIAQLVEQELGS